MSNDLDPLYFSESPARLSFKKAVGQTNHFVITALVGLSGIETGSVIEAPAHLHTSWSPDDKITSAKRTASFILESALVRVSDSVDSYIAEARIRPSLLQSQRVRDAIDGANGKAVPRLKALLRTTPGITKSTAALVQTMFAWRNRIVHGRAETEVSETSRLDLIEGAKAIAERYQSLDASLLLSHFDERRSPALKESTGLVRAAHDFVQEVDQLYIGQLDFERYLFEAIALDTFNKGHDSGERTRLRKKRIADIWGRDEERKVAALRGAFRTLGFSLVRRGAEWLGAMITSDQIDALQKLSVSEAYGRLVAVTNDDSDFSAEM